MQEVEPVAVVEETAVGWTAVSIFNEFWKLVAKTLDKTQAHRLYCRHLTNTAGQEIKMTTYFTYSGRSDKKNLQLDGDLLTGDTYDVKNFIRQHCGGKWDKAANGWRVNVDKMMALTEIRNQIGLDIDNSVRPQTHKQSTMSRAQYYDLITEGHGKDW